MKQTESRPKVSVVITARNYGKYICQCIDSVINQRYDDHEIIVVNDGSTDNTAVILADYERKYPGKLGVITLDGVGLAGACNRGIRASRGEYIVRLDADDYFDENLLLLESNILDSDPHIHMVYPDYYRITRHGEIIDYCRLSKANVEVKLLDRSPLAAGAMYRRECYDAIGGYNEELSFQEDYDFWVKFIDKFNVYNINLPLLYYRQHGNNMSKNFEARMEARRYVKKKFVLEKGYREGKKILAVIPAMGLFRNKEKLALRDLAGRPLIAYTIEEARKTELIDRVVVSTEDREIAEVAVRYGAEVPFLRPLSLARTSVSVDDVLRNLLDGLEEMESYEPDIVVVLQYYAPFRKECHITEAIDTLLLYDTDSVISVTPDISFHWKPGKYGLTPVGYQKRLLREDRETVYKETGSVYVVRADNIRSGGYLGEVIGHTEMSRTEAWRIEEEFDLWVAAKYIEERALSEEQGGAGTAEKHACAEHLPTAEPDKDRFGAAG